MASVALVTKKNNKPYNQFLPLEETLDFVPFHQKINKNKHVVKRVIAAVALVTKNKLYN